MYSSFKSIIIKRSTIATKIPRRIDISSSTKKLNQPTIQYVVSNFHIKDSLKIGQNIMDIWIFFFANMDLQPFCTGKKNVNPGVDLWVHYVIDLQ